MLGRAAVAMNAELHRTRQGRCNSKRIDLTVTPPAASIYERMTDDVYGLSGPSGTALDVRVVGMMPIVAGQL